MCENIIIAVIIRFLYQICYKLERYKLIISFIFMYNNIINVELIFNSYVLQLLQKYGVNDIFRRSIFH